MKNNLGDLVGVWSNLFREVLLTCKPGMPGRAHTSLTATKQRPSNVGGIYVPLYVRGTNIVRLYVKVYLLSFASYFLKESIGSVRSIIYRHFWVTVRVSSFLPLPAMEVCSEEASGPDWSSTQCSTSTHIPIRNFLPCAETKLACFHTSSQAYQNQSHFIVLCNAVI
jgi:hypothetical protein